MAPGGLRLLRWNFLMFCISILELWLFMLVLLFILIADPKNCLLYASKAPK